MSDVVVPLVLLLVVLVVLGAVGGIGWLVVRKRAAGQQGAPQPTPAGTAEPGARQPVERSAVDRRQPRRTMPVGRLAPESRERYLAAWRGVQSRFPERPALALGEADAILASLLSELGFPLDDPRPAGELLSDEHARVLDGFRAGHALEQANTSSRSDEEQVRRGMEHFAGAFAALLGGGSSPYPDSRAAQASRSPR